VNKQKSKRIFSIVVLSLLALSVLAAIGNVYASPTYSSLSVSSTSAGSSCTFYATFNDATALNPNGQVTFGTNNTGVWFWSSPANFTVTPETNSFALTLNANAGYVVAYMWNFTNNAQASNSTGLQYLTTTTAITSPTNTPSTSISYSNGPPTSVFWFIALIAILIIGTALACLIPNHTAGIGIGLAFGLSGIFGTAFFAQAGVLIMSQYTDVNTNVTYYQLMPIGLWIILPIMMSILCLLLPIASSIKRRS
jgi:hypothetical protein